MDEQHLLTLPEACKSLVRGPLRPAMTSIVSAICSLNETDHG